LKMLKWRIMVAKVKQSNIETRRLALAEKHEHDRRLLEFHRKIYDLLKFSDRADEIQKSALNRIALWKEKQLCSDEYINDWKLMLANLDDFERMALNKSDNGVALRQNSPFSAFMKELMESD